MKTVQWLTIATISSLLFGVLFLPALAGQTVYRLVALAKGRKRPTLWYLFQQIAVAVDVAAGSVLYGSRHTISAKTGQLAAQGGKWHTIQEKMIDAMFYRGHCKTAATKENLTKENL